MSSRRRRIVAVFGGVLLLLASNASAQLSDDETRNAARNLAGEAKTAFEQGDFERARDLFHRAYSLVQAPTIAVYEARALVKLQRLVEAEEAYTRAARTELDAKSSEAFQRAVEEAESELARLRPRVPRLLVVPTGPGGSHPNLDLRIDGSALPAALRGVEAPLDPGRHKLSARAPGGNPVELQFELAEGQKLRLEIAVPASNAANAAPAPSEKPVAKASPRTQEGESPASPTRTWQAPVGLALGGLGVAGLATGIVAGVMATSRHSDATEACPEGACEPGSQGWEDAQAFRTLRTVSSVGYVVGIIGVAGGVTLLLTAPKSQPTPHLALRVGPGELTLKGAF